LQMLKRLSPTIRPINTSWYHKRAKPQ
jgi:hypothetical protein